MALEIRPAKAQHGLAHVALTHIREAIAEGRLVPGQHLTETELAEALGVSRGPVREALTELQHEGLVVLRRHRGAEVATLSRQDIDEVYSLRLALERLAVQRATTMATSEDFARMDEALNRFAPLTPHATPQELAALDLEFHDLLYEAARHQRLSAAWRHIRPQVYVFLVSRNVVNRDFYRIAHAEHTEIRRVILSGDLGAAVEQIELHLEGAYQRLLLAYEAGNGKESNETKAE